MELKILSNNENKLLGRKEITFSVEQEGSTANRTELTKELCKRLNLHPESTVIVSISQTFGTRQSTGTAHSYSDKETLAKYEKMTLARIAKRTGKSKAKEGNQAPEGDKKE
jgi:small subunit ribosomal protein S24e